MLVPRTVWKIYNNTVFSEEPVAIVLQFGNFDERSNAKLTFENSEGDLITVSLSGEGWGEIVSESEFPSIMLYDTGINSALKITVKGGSGNIVIEDITTDGSLKSITAKNCDLNGDITIDGILIKLVLNNVLNVAGIWKFWAYVTIAGKSYPGEPIRLRFRTEGSFRNN